MYRLWPNTVLGCPWRRRRSCSARQTWTEMASSTTTSLLPWCFGTLRISYIKSYSEGLGSHTSDNKPQIYTRLKDLIETGQSGRKKWTVWRHKRERWDEKWERNSLKKRWSIDVTRLIFRTLCRVPIWFLKKRGIAILGSGLDFKLIFRIVKGRFSWCLQAADARLPSTVISTIQGTCMSLLVNNLEVRKGGAWVKGMDWGIVL